MKNKEELKLAVIITMFDERELVANSIKQICQFFTDPTIIVVQSDDGADDFNCEGLTSYCKLPNLFGTVPDLELPARAVCRNLSCGFRQLYQDNKDYDLVVALTGDTLIADAAGIYRTYSKMKNNGAYLACSQPVGAKQNGCTSDDPPKLILEGRVQTDNMADFICCLFFVEGGFAERTKAFSNIRITNPFTSEQCLGDAYMRSAGDLYWQRHVLRLNSANAGDCYSFRDGWVYHARNGRPGR